MAPMIGNQQREFFERNGYLIVAGHLAPARVAAVRAAVEQRYAREGARAGWEQPAVAPFVRRLCNLFSKGDLFVELATDPLVLEFAEMMIGRPVTWHAMNAHDPLPGYQHPHQPIHADRQNWHDTPAYFNVLWALDEITAENGATRLVPGSHRRPFPATEVADPFAAVPGEVLATCPAGSAIMVHGDTWHGARANCSTGPRRMLHVGYTRPGGATQYEIAATLSPELRRRLAPLSDRLVLP
jgi:ectoine hydroxylase-related dioxygenase (phytanoyl-CoA dioxygenase family)